MKQENSNTVPHKLRLIHWANDRYPPIDFGNEGKAIIELVREYQNLEHENKALKADNEKAGEAYIAILSELSNVEQENEALSASNKELREALQKIYSCYGFPLNAADARGFIAIAEKALNNTNQ